MNPIGEGEGSWASAYNINNILTGRVVSDLFDYAR